MKKPRGIIDRPGIAFERLVGQIQQKLDPNVKISHDEKIVDRHGTPRQFDLVLRGIFAGHSILGVIECKDYGRKVTIEVVDAFKTKSDEANAQIRILVSRRGFTGNALARCAKYGIEALSLLDGDTTNRGFFVGIPIKGTITTWKSISVWLLRYSGKNEPLIVENQNDIKINGLPIIPWFTNILRERALDRNGNSTPIIRAIIFRYPRHIYLSDRRAWFCRGIIFRAERTVEKKTFWAGVTGEAFIDWSTPLIRFPPNASLNLSVPTDILSWETTKPRSGIEIKDFGFEMISDAGQFVDNPTAIDLESL